MAQRQRRPPPNKKPSSLKAFYYVVAVIMLAGAGWVGYSLMTGGGSNAALQATTLTGLSRDSLLALAHGVPLGQPDAPIQITVFSDFTCPSCARWNAFIEPGLKRDYIEAGKVRLTYYDYPLGGATHVHGFLAARAARCAEAQGMFWEYHDALFRTQQEWAMALSPPIDAMVDHARDLNLDVDAFEACVDSDQFADLVSANHEVGRGLGVGGTPTVYLEKELLQRWDDYGLVSAAIDSALNKSN